MIQFIWIYFVIYFDKHRKIVSYLERVEIISFYETYSKTHLHIDTLIAQGLAQIIYVCMTVYQFSSLRIILLQGKFIFCYR